MLHGRTIISKHALGRPGNHPRFSMSLQTHYYTIIYCSQKSVNKMQLGAETEGVSVARGEREGNGEG